MSHNMVSSFVGKKATAVVSSGKMAQISHVRKVGFNRLIVDPHCQIGPELGPGSWAHPYQTIRWIYSWPGTSGYDCISGVDIFIFSNLQIPVSAGGIVGQLQLW